MRRILYVGTVVLAPVVAAACASGGPAARSATDSAAAPAAHRTAAWRAPREHRLTRAVSATDTADEALEVLDPFLAERMAGLAERSRSWRAALDTLRRSGFRVVVGRPDDLREEVSALARHRVRHFGEVIPLRGGSGRIVGVAVAIDVDRVRRLVEDAELPSRVVGADVDRILIHEIYGHVVPLARTRRLSGGCPDPAPGAPAASSCAIRRENRIRAELGLEPRTAYDLTGLAIGRYLRGQGLDEALRAPDPR